MVLGGYTYCIDQSQLYTSAVGICVKSVIITAFCIYSLTQRCSIRAPISVERVRYSAASRR